MTIPAPRFVLNGTITIGHIFYTKIDDTHSTSDGGQALLVRAGSVAAQHVCDLLNAAEPIPSPVPVPVPPPVPTPVPVPVPTPTPVPVPPGPVPPSSRLLQLADFVTAHAGSFTLPKDQFSYSRRGLALSADRTRLYVSNIDTGKQCSLVTIPALGGVAALVAGPVDPCEGTINSIGGDPPAMLAGYWARRDGSLVVSAYDWYDGSDTQHGAFFTRPADLTVKGMVRGAFPAVGAPAPRFAGGYFAQIPAAWQSAFGGDLLTGLCCTNIISGTSYGPSAGVMRESDIGVGNAWRGAVYYTKDHPLRNQWNVTSDIFNGTSEITGVAFIGDTVLFVGRQGGGKYFYGQVPQDGTDPVDQNKGNHAYPYRHQVWLYNARDLAAVLAGSTPPWEIVPYAYGALGGLPPTPWGRTIGCAFDEAQRTLYIGQGFATGFDGADPVIHVFHIPV